MAAGAMAAISQSGPRDSLSGGLTSSEPQCLLLSVQTTVPAAWMFVMTKRDNAHSENRVRPEAPPHRPGRQARPSCKNSFLTYVRFISSLRPVSLSVKLGNSSKYLLSAFNQCFPGPSPAQPHLTPAMTLRNRCHY